MIVPPDASGVAFSESADGDLRPDSRARALASAKLGISDAWAWTRQMHGNTVRRVTSAGEAGEADALWTTERALPLAVFTADCFGVVLEAEGAVGVAHAGWRGASQGVVSALRGDMAREGADPRAAYVGPGIGPCCYEVGTEVAELFPGHERLTTWGSRSVDLAGSILDELDGLPVWSSGSCTHHESSWFSHRRDGTTKRLASIGWLP